ncbi:MAG: nucleoside monophosphate kinase [Phycisphaeraceae bacterium]|nr:nucleoside monophosphate kinase [Phycisphaeraceae bacterium]
MAPGKITSILLFGVPGSGKGTQGAILGRIPGFVHLAMGDVFRSLDRQSPLGRKFMEYSTRGELVPDDLTIEIWRDHVDSMIASGAYRPNREFLLLDGIPRSAAQAEALAPFVDVRLVIHLVAKDQEEMVERMRRRALQQQRPDDADVAVIRRRFEVYRESTKPVLCRFDRSLIRDIEASGTPGRVLLSILEAVVPLQESTFTNPLGH